MRKQLTISGLEKKLDRIFSVFVRLRHARNGYCQCVTCGKWHHWKDIDAGHYWKRQHQATRWDERNVHPQDTHCNKFRGGAEAEHATYILAKYGKAVYDELAVKHSMIAKFTRADLEGMIEKYSGLVKQMERHT